MIAECIENELENPTYTVGKKYKITEIGMTSNFWYNDPNIDSWYGQFSNDLKPEFKEGVVFKRKSCKFIIRKEEGE